MNQNFGLNSNTEEEERDVFAGLDFTPVEEYEEERDVFAGLDFTPVEETKTALQYFKKLEIPRHVARGATRMTEAVAGLPGDVQNLVEKGFHGLVNLASGGRLGRFALEEDPYETIQRVGKLPTTENIREVTRALTGETLEPQGPGEALADDILEDAAVLAFPVKGKIPFARAIGGSVVANLGKKFAEKIGIGEKGQVATKIGLLVASGLVGSQSARSFASQEYKRAINMIPEDATVSGKVVESKLGRFAKELEKGGISPSKEPAHKLSKQLQGAIKRNKGNLPAEELPAYRASVNDYRFGKGMISDKAHYHLDRFDEVLNESLNEYGKLNPEFLKQYKKALTAYSGVKQTRKIARFISKKVDPNRFSSHTLALFGHMAIAHPVAAGTAGALYGTAKGYKILSRFAKNPVLRNHYLNVINQAMKKNSPAMIRSLEKLDKEIQDFDFEEI